MKQSDMTFLGDYRVGKRGARGLAVSVPSKWARASGVKDGSVLRVARDKSGNLIFSPVAEVVA